MGGIAGITGKLGCYTYQQRKYEALVGTSFYFFFVTQLVSCFLKYFAHNYRTDRCARNCHRNKTFWWDESLLTSTLTLNVLCAGFASLTYSGLPNVPTG